MVDGTFNLIYYKPNSNLNKGDFEKYRENITKVAEQLNPKLDFADYYKNLLPGIELVSILSRITETVRPPLVDIAIYQNIIGNSALTELAATASKMGNMIGTYMEVINPIQRSINKSIIEMQSVLVPTTSIINETIKNYYSEINAIRDILQPINMEYVRTALESQEALRNVMNSGIQSHMQVFGAELNKILNFTHHDKLFNFANVQQDIMAIRPFY